MVAEAVDAKPAKKHLDRIRDRVTRGKCLLCEGSATRRGLCTNCYFAFRRATAGMKSSAEAQAMKAKAIRDGKILPANFCRQIKRPNPFLVG